ncbi:Piso0_000431 [Millerozyma farinosa CBS 7064]|uniref:Protein transport protein SEC23 n=1 Tax=Pichia sorbitophila (strain ATCC MYA-4447 / BCRC 22081 / CBS 7064 / NBRC 10061 / NRRL Y-12695) TaxID=559304 RepID=G8YTZ4_PICSO|nr:Piso0_000431 [Millerozyma farinosa CBS 7064]CCE73395.1 Piso0_000431 [Millerozyma farinosa CBS 7064]
MSSSLAMKDRFQESERKFGIRFNWNVLASTRLEESRLVCPTGCLYRPFFDADLPAPNGTKPEIMKVTGFPEKCSHCGTLLNRYSGVDKLNAMWRCNMCNSKNFFAGHGNESRRANEDSDIQGSHNGFEVIEYHLPDEITDSLDQDLAFAYIFIIDRYENIDNADKSKSSFRSLVQSIESALQRLPDGCLVGIISFDEAVYLHQPLDHNTTIEVSATDIMKEGTSAGKGSQWFDFNLIGVIYRKLGLTGVVADKWQNSQHLIKNLLIKLDSASRMTVIRELNDLKPKLTRNFKPVRVTGLAILVTSVLLSVSYKNFIGKSILFTSGPCTVDPGRVHSLSAKSPMRSHNAMNDIENVYTPEALKFYTAMAYVANGYSFKDAFDVITTSSKKITDILQPKERPRWSFDLFACSLDQSGIFEMKPLAQNTTGQIFLSETFFDVQFKEMLLKSIFNVLEKKYAFRGNLSVFTSDHLKVSRLISSGCNVASTFQSEKSSDKHSDFISDIVDRFDSTMKKREFTNNLSLNFLDSADTVAVFFHLNTYGSTSQVSTSSPKDAYIQFQIKYLDMSTRSWKIRQTTIQMATTMKILSFLRGSAGGDLKLVNETSHLMKERRLLESFDQKTWLILLVRLLLEKADTNIGYTDFKSIIGIFDNSVAQLIQRFKKPLKGPSHFHSIHFKTSTEDDNLLFHENFNELITYAFQIRRNPDLFSIFNTSPDETAFHHSWFLRADPNSSNLIMRPRLYLLGQTGNVEQEFPLETKYVIGKYGCFFILDCFFHIIIYKAFDPATGIGKLSLHHSRNERSNDEDLDIPMKFLSNHLSCYNRSLTPKVIISQTNHAQSRYLFSRLASEDPFEQVPQTGNSGHNSILKSLRNLFVSNSSDLTEHEQSVDRYYQYIYSLVQKFESE